MMISIFSSKQKIDYFEILLSAGSDVLIVYDIYGVGFFCYFFGREYFYVEVKSANSGHFFLEKNLFILN